MIIKQVAQANPGRRHTLGQSLVEAALILPILTLLMLGVIEFGLILYAHVQVANAAREAARAASLYNSTRYARWSDGSLPSKCEGTIEGWSLNQTVQQAVVYHALTASGSKKDCPNSSGTVMYTSLGRLNSTQVFTATVAPAQSTYYSAANNPESSPTPGTTGTVKLVYPYRLPILSNLIPYLKDPVLVTKSVQFQYEQ
jgi:Flp pilus assembly protein TadG